jgi:hypothetical protein
MNCDLGETTHRRSVRATIFHKKAEFEAFQRICYEDLLSDWPLPRPRQWMEHVNPPAVDVEIALPTIKNP